jgi:hypothetical protein
MQRATHGRPYTVGTNQQVAFGHLPACHPQPDATASFGESSYGALGRDGVQADGV